MGEKTSITNEDLWEIKSDQKKRISDFLGLLLGIILALSTSLIIEGYIQEKASILDTSIEISDQQIDFYKDMIYLGITGVAVTFIAYLLFLFSRIGYLFTFPLKNKINPETFISKIQNDIGKEYLNYRVCYSSKYIYFWRILRMYVISVKIDNSRIQILLPDDKKLNSKLIPIGKLIASKIPKGNRNPIDKDILYPWEFVWQGWFTSAWPLFFSVCSIAIIILIAVLFRMFA